MKRTCQTCLQSFSYKIKKTLPLQQRLFSHFYGICTTTYGITCSYYSMKRFKCALGAYCIKKFKQFGFIQNHLWRNCFMHGNGIRTHLWKTSSYQWSKAYPYSFALTWYHLIGLNLQCGYFPTCPHPFFQKGSIKAWNIRFCFTSIQFLSGTLKSI